MKKIYTLLILALLCISATKAHAQHDYVIHKAFKLDSVTIFIQHMHTQTPAEDSGSIQEYLRTYIKVKKGVLYAEFPKGYVTYWVDDPVTGIRAVDKEMIIVEKYQGEKGKTVHYIRESELIGKKVNLCKTTESAYLYLSL